MRCHSMPRGIRKFVALAMTLVITSTAGLLSLSHEVAVAEAVSRPVLGFQEGLIAAMKDGATRLRVKLDALIRAMERDNN